MYHVIRFRSPWRYATASDCDGYGLDSHSWELNIFISNSDKKLNLAPKQVMCRKFSEKWELECLSLVFFYLAK